VPLYSLPGEFLRDALMAGTDANSEPGEACDIRHEHRKQSSTDRPGVEMAAVGAGF
jgi:hypothetical protein